MQHGHVRTVLAPGSGDGTALNVRAGSCASRNSGARVLLARIEPAPAEGKFPRGTFDDEGYGLHLAYSIQARDALPHFDYPGVRELDQTNELVVPFGPGTHWLNYPGEVRLVGGKGLWLVDLQVIDVERPKPHWHWLLRRLKGAMQVSVPSHHSMVGCCSGTAVMTWLDDTTVQASSTPVPVMGPLVMKAGSGTTLAFSGWYG